MSYTSNETAIIRETESETNSTNNKLNLRKDIFEHITTVVHTLSFWVVGFIIFLCFNSKFTFFTWHPLLYSIGWMCMMTEAILVVTPDNIFSKRLSFKLRVQYHWIIQLLAIGCNIGGFFIDFINKNQNNRPHFQSSHGIIGLIAMVCCIPTCINGFAALFSVQLKKYIRPSINKVIHAICGIIAFVLGSAAMVLGLYTWWFQTKASRASQIFCFTVIIFATTWCLVRPLITSFNRVKSIVS